MVVIFIAHCQHQNVHSTKTEKVSFLKIVSLHVPSTFNSYMPLQDGRAPLLMPEYMRVPVRRICSFPMGNIISPMLDSHHAGNSSFPIVDHGITLLNGVEHV
jgi:hypothetical protein